MSRLIKTTSTHQVDGRLTGDEEQGAADDRDGFDVGQCLRRADRLARPHAEPTDQGLSPKPYILNPKPVNPKPADSFPHCLEGHMCTGVPVHTRRVQGGTRLSPWPQ